MMMRHLVWKDGMTIRPLVIAILIGLLVVFTFLSLATAWFPSNSFADVFVCVWVLMPNLVALGAPALLVGGEEESGTLSWMRTLPVRWQDVADAKFFVAAAAVATSWIASSLLLCLTRTTVATQSTMWADSMLSISGVCYLLFFSFLLLICGFITAYLFRSPVAGLIAVVPLIAIVNSLALETGKWLLTGHFGYPSALESASQADYLRPGIAGAVLLLAAGSLQRILARRRLTSSETNVLSRITVEKTVSAYRPPLLAVNTTRPNQAAALLWQQTRQMGALGLMLTVIIAVFLVLFFAEFWGYQFGSRRYPLVNHNRVLRFLQDFSPFVIVVGASWLGALAFYGDNVRRRCAFFADRGIASTKIWWTRLLLPSAFCALLVAVVMTAQRTLGGSRTSFEVFPVIIVVNFAFGQLVGQWMKRPVLAFFAAPAYTAVSTLVLFVMLEYYPTYYSMAVLLVPVLLLASWRLSSRWLAGRVDFGYHRRVVAYTALAVALPIVAVIATRVASTPAPMPRWRASVLAMQIPTVSVDSDPQGLDPRPISPDAFTRTGASADFERASTAERMELLQQELDGEWIGEFVSLDDIDAVLDTRSSASVELKTKALEVSLQWARQIREQVAAGKRYFFYLEHGAESAELVAVVALENLTNAGVAEPILAELVRSIPNRKLREQSRRMGLIREWQAYQAREWKQESPGYTRYGKEFPGYTRYGKNFMHYPVAFRVAAFPFERRRSDRYVDELTRLLLDQLNGGLPESESSPGFLERDRLWQQAIGPAIRRYHPQVLRSARTWTQQYERRIELLKARCGVAPE